MQKSENRSSYTIYQNTTKIDKRFKHSHDTIKILVENIGSEISDIPRSNIFANISLKAREIREKINKWDYIRLKASAWLKKLSSK